MYAIVDIAGQQFKVEKDQKIFVHRLQDKEGSKVSFKKILLLDDGKGVKIGSPNLDGASVDAKVISHLKDDKVIVFKKKRRKGYRVKNGHRQLLSEIQISSISSSGSKSKTKASETKIDVKSETNLKAKPKKETKVKAPKKDFSSMSVADLKNMAKDKGLTGISKMKKADLIKALS